MAVRERVQVDNTEPCCMRSHRCPSTRPGVELSANPVNNNEQCHDPATVSTVNTTNMRYYWLTDNSRYHHIYRG